MSRLLAAIAVLVAPTALAQPVGAPDAGAGSEIRQLYGRMDEALDRKDPLGFVSMMAPDAKLTDEHGVSTTIADLRAMLSKAMAQVGEVSSHTEAAALIGSGDRAWATTRQVVHVKVMPAGGGTPVPMTLTSVAVDTWGRRAEGWRIIEERTLMVAREVDHPAGSQASNGMPDTTGWTNAQKMQYANQLACQTRMLMAMGWQRQGYLAVMPSCP